MGLGHLGYLGIAKESVWGNKIVPPTEFLEIQNDSLEAQIAELASAGINNTRTPTKSRQGAKSVLGQIPYEVNAEDFIGHNLLSILPTEVLVDDGAGNGGQHTFKPGDSLPAGYTIQAGRDVAVLDFFGGQCGQINIAFDSNAFVIATSDWVFKDVDDGSVSIPSFTAEKPLVTHTATLNIDGSAADVKSGNITISAGLKSERSKIGSQLTSALVHRTGVYTVSGELAVYFDSKTLRDKFLNRTAASFDVEFTGTNIGTTQRALKITVPNLFFNGETEKLTSRDDEIMLTLPFRADKASGLEMVEVLLKNSRRTAY